MYIFSAKYYAVNYWLPMIAFVGVIYLKNMIVQYWKERDPSELADTSAAFVIVEQDKATIRENIVEAVIHAPELIR